MAYGSKEVLGIFQPDIILRSGLVAGLNDLRRNAYLLDFCFASLNADPMTTKNYGQASIDSAKKWFLATDIKVKMADLIEISDLPAITLSIQPNQESYKTLGDIHYVSGEDIEISWPTLSDKFTPVSYDASTGLLVIPTAIADSLLIFPGQVIVDSVGNQVPIEEVLSRTQVKVPVGTIADFGMCVIKSAKPPQTMEIESTRTSDNYQIGCHVANDQLEAIYLHSIVMFILLRYREAYFEDRGLQVTSISSSQFAPEQDISPQQAYSRYITLKGVSEHTWPKHISDKLQGAETQIKMIGGDHLPAGHEASNSIWVGEKDALTLGS